MLTDHGNQHSRLVCKVDTLVASLHHTLRHCPRILQLHQAVVHNHVEDVLQAALVLGDADHLELLPLVEGAGGEGPDGVVQGGGVVVLVGEENLSKPLISGAPVTIIPEVQGEAQGTTFLQGAGQNILTRQEEQH